MNDDDIRNQSINDLLSPQARKHVQVSSKEAQEKFDEKMREIDIKEKERITQDRAMEIGLGYIFLKGFPIAPDVLGIIPEEVAREQKTICFLLSGGQMRLGTTDPSNPKLLELMGKLEKENKAHGEVYLISDYSFAQAMKLYASIPKVKKYVSGIEITEQDFQKYHNKLMSFKAINENIQQVNISEIITLLVAGAIQNDSSDIHIEAEEDDVKVRYRMDGVLHDVASLPTKDWPKIISRIKLFSGLKINVANVPQDGRFTIHLSKAYIDVRVSCVPTSFGESVVMRLLYSSSLGVKFEDLGLRGKAYAILQREVQRPNGMILTTGPTGSGKTTTLYAFLNVLNQPDRKIITLENPVEYKIHGINQSEVNVDKDYTFANGLKSVLRQDPDIVMVGEVRDAETAEIAIQAALTGHLMLSTMHTNDAAGAIPRLLSLNVVPYLLAPALNVVIGQRLVRKVCPHCKQPVTIPEDLLARAKQILSTIPESSGEKRDTSNLAFYKGAGCEKCNHIGYKGRIGIFEVLNMNTDIEKLIVSGQVSEFAMHDIAIKHGMVTMVQDGLLKALDGITTVEEVFKVTE